MIFTTVPPGSAIILIALLAYVSSILLGCFGDFFPPLLLKRQSHKIFDLHFFHKSMTPRALINTLKYFLILFRFCAGINEFILTCIARSRDSALCNIARSFSNFVSSKTSRYATLRRVMALLYST
jgi:hypothetical protein